MRRRHYRRLLRLTAVSHFSSTLFAVLSNGPLDHWVNVPRSRRFAVPPSFLCRAFGAASLGLVTFLKATLLSFIPRAMRDPREFVEQQNEVVARNYTAASSYRKLPRRYRSKGTAVARKSSEFVTRIVTPFPQNRTL